MSLILIIIVDCIVIAFVVIIVSVIINLNDMNDDGEYALWIYLERLCVILLFLFFIFVIIFVSFIKMMMISALLFLRLSFVITVVIIINPLFNFNRVIIDLINLVVNFISFVEVSVSLKVV